MSDVGFYDSGPWRRKRVEVLRKCNWECQLCKRRGRHAKAVIVHHVYHFDRFPEWGLWEFVDDPVTGERQRNLLPVCRACHETECHPERIRELKPKCEPLTEERW
ncbi:MAG: HNH endonuclease [Oscillospiraceae bacterium]|nr:HNH endonuclease [Oscillospiraceae bacterium]